MIDPKVLAATSSSWNSEKDWQTKARSAARTATSVKNLLQSDLALSVQERAVLESACEVLRKAVSVYKTTGRIAAESANKKAKRKEEARVLVEERFASMQGIADRLTLIAAAARSELDPIRSNVVGLMDAPDPSAYAQSIFEKSFKVALDNIADHVSAQSSQSLSDCVAAKWSKWHDEMRPKLLTEHAALIVRLQQALPHQAA